MDKQQKQQNHQSFKLPERLVTSVDLMRTIRELKYLDDWLNQASIRSGGEQVTPPKTSATLDEVANSNEVSLLDPDHRKRLIIVLESFASSAPKIHMSFAVEPSANFLHRMILWLRTNVNSAILLDVGLQPALTAGCSVRTTNKFFDMSLRNHFKDSRHFLVEAIETIEEITPATVAAANATATAPVPETKPSLAEQPKQEQPTVPPVIEPAPIEQPKAEVKAE